MPALLIKRDPRSPHRRIIYSGEIKIGTIYEAVISIPEAQFKWVSESGNYGYGKSFGEALRGLSEKVPDVLAMAAERAEDQAYFNALPGHIQDLVIAERRTSVEFMREQNRMVIREDSLTFARSRWEAALVALNNALAANNISTKAA